MNCPVCNIPLNLSERQGVEIDYCPQCRGVWLDRGELDKIIEKSTPSGVRGREEQPYSRQTQEPAQHGRHGDDHDYDHHGKKKRKSFLSELFD
jgi:Zn-finger nucleic acid-binding protein